MPRTSLTPQVMPGRAGYTGLVVTMTAADVANDNQAAFTDGMMLIAHNTGAGGHNILVTSIGDNMNRLSHGSQSIGAGAYALFGPFTAEGWKQADGKLYFDADHAEVLFGVLK